MGVKGGSFTQLLSALVILWTNIPIHVLGHTSQQRYLQALQHWATTQHPKPVSYGWTESYDRGHLVHPLQRWLSSNLDKNIFFDFYSPRLFVAMKIWSERDLYSFIYLDDSACCSLLHSLQGIAVVFNAMKSHAKIAKFDLRNIVNLSAKTGEKRRQNSKWQSCRYKCYRTFFVK